LADDPTPHYFADDPTPQPPPLAGEGEFDGYPSPARGGARGRVIGDMENGPGVGSLAIWRMGQG